MSSYGNKAIAIVGIGCRFPGGVADSTGFWRLLCEGRSAIGPIPRDRIDLDRYFDAEPQTPGRMVASAGGFLDGIDGFDAEFFSISPREAERLDPQQRLLLETAWEAIEDSGTDAASLERKRVGVFVGQWLSDFEARLFRDPEAVDFYMTLGSGRYASAGRIAYAFDLIGPTVTIDAACSSSLVAIHLAVQSLRSGEVCMALAGGANVILEPHIHIAYSQSGMIAPDGRCKFGDARADGYVRSEGAAIVALKTLDQAQADGDRIYAVIRGSAVNNDGRGSGSMGTPSVAGQKDLLETAYRDAGIRSHEVGYVEAHGTGTRAGDAVELQALSDVMGRKRQVGVPLLVGSVKTNLGHTEGAAGVASLIKAALTVQHGFVPASLNFNERNPSIPWAEMPVTIAGIGTPWRGDGPRRAGVSSFGIAGTNAHVVLEEPPHPREVAHQAALLPLLTLSARSEAAARELALRLADSLAGAQRLEAMAEIVAYAQRRRAAHAFRAVFLADDPARLQAALRDYAAGGTAFAEGTASQSKPAKVAFVFPGQGGQWKGMARELLETTPAFRDALYRAEEVIRAETGWSLVERLQHDAEGDPCERIDFIQPALATISIAYAAWLQEHGVEVAAVVGHSMGEAAAAHVAGALSLEDALRIVCLRSRLMLELSGKGAMALVDLPEADVTPKLARYERRVSIAAINSPQACVISGDKDAVTTLVEAFTAEGAFSRLINVDVASHSPQMEGPAEALRTQLANLMARSTAIPFVSSVRGRTIDGHELDASYWARNLRQSVRFCDALHALGELEISAIVELGPHPVLAPSIEQSAVSSNGRPHTVVCCGRRDEPETTTLLSALAQLWCAGAAIDWGRGAHAPAKVVDFPHYPWQRQRYWVGNADIPHGRSGAKTLRRIPEEHRQWLHRLVWRELPPAAPTSAHAMWTVIGECPEIARALSAAGAASLQVSLASLEDQLAALGESGRASNVLLVAPDGGCAPLLPMRAARALPASNSIRLWFATRGGRAPEGSARVDADQGALWGAARVFGSERPDVWGGLIDLPAGSLDDDSAAQAAARLLDPGVEDQIAVRGAHAFVPRLVAASEEPGVNISWHSDGAYLITGGLGDVGLCVAEQLVKEGACRLILMGRTALPPRSEWTRVDAASKAGKRIAGIRKLEHMGAAVQCATVDVSDEAAVRDFLAGYGAEGWPPIRGVLHLAASLDRRLIEKFTQQSFEIDLRAKLRSAQILDRLLSDLDCFILFASQITLFPQPGMSAYAAANAGLEALAIARRARGAAASAVVWGQWRGAGLISGDVGDVVTRELEERGLKSFEPADAAALLSFAAGRAEPVMSVMSVDWAAFSAARGNLREPFLSELVVAAHGGALADRLASSSPVERKTMLVATVVQALSRTLRIPAERIDAATPFGAMGLTSILAMELRNRLERELSRPLSVTLAWNYPSVETLSSFLAGESERQEADKAPVELEPALEVTHLVNAISRETDAEVIDALRRPRRSRGAGR